MALKATGAEPAVLSSFRANNSWMSWSNRLRRHLPPRREFPRDDVCGYPVFRGWDTDRAGEVVQRFRPDVIVVQSTRPEKLLGAVAPSGVPYCVYFHEVEEIDHLKGLATTGILAIANSDFTATRLLERCGLNCEVVLPLVEPRYYVTPMHPQRVLFVNTVPRKGLEIAFQLAEHRLDINFDFVLSWILKPERAAELEARAHRSGNIVLHRPTSDMRSLYANTRLLLAPSQWEETWGRVATEAHINGIPVLGSNRGGLTQAIGSGGLALPAEAPITEWLIALSRIWDSPKDYQIFAQAAHEYGKRAEIQPTVIVARLQEILKNVIDRDKEQELARR